MKDTTKQMRHYSSLFTDHAQQSPDRLLRPALAAETEKQIVAQPGAEGAVVNAVFAHAGINQLADVCQVQIQMAFAVRLRVGDQIFGVVVAVPEFEKHLRPDFKNGGADRGAQSGM